ncbi:Zinc finger and SCAN domain-containing protein 29 [Chelonia mydas]|uniref:Zinc finger and SCAN domain-containing protein 29 n=1 Tax=Chelonia mydas TaxID=8469 RepID=M7B927_CHEMY|nr:Zinc finger and SCAN domain-containing protein 29 [Chelonia mydas]
MHWQGRQEKAHKLLNFNFLFGQRGKLQVTMQSSSAEVTMQNSSAEVTMMESQNRKRAPAWTEREVRDLIAVWGEESVLSELRSSFRNAKTFVKISEGMKDRGHNRDPNQCRVKLKELRQAYQKTREANGRSGSEPQTCRFYDAFVGVPPPTPPAVLFDSFNGDGANTETGFGDEENYDDEVVDSSQQASGEIGFPDSQELFFTLDMEPVPPEPTQGCLLDPAGGEGTSGDCAVRLLAFVISWVLGRRRCSMTARHRRLLAAH